MANEQNLKPFGSGHRSESEERAIQKSAKEWEDKYNADTKALEDRLEAQEYSHAADMFMSKYQFTSKPAREGIMAEFNKKGFKLEDGKFLGAEDYMKTLMESEDYKGAFKTEEKPEVNEPENKPFFVASTQSHSNPENTPAFSFGFTGVRKHD